MSTSVVLVGLVLAGLVLVATATGGAAPAGMSRSGTVPLALLSLGATGSYLVLLLALHVLPTGYSPIRHAVSDYAVGRYEGLFRAGLYSSSLGVLALAVGLLRGVGAPPLAARDLSYLMLIPLARIGMSLFPTTLEGERLSRRGAVHYAFAVAAFTLTYLVISQTTPALARLAQGLWLQGPLRATASGVAPALALLVVTMLPRLRRVFGAFERLFLVTTNVWFVLVALLVIRHS